MKETTLEQRMFMYRLLFVFAVFSILPAQGQTAEEAQEALKDINDLEQLESLKAAHPDWTISIRKTLSEGKTFHSTLHRASIGETPIIYSEDGIVQYQHKIVAKGNEEVCKVKYIFLDGKRRNTKDLNALRARIIRAYKEGTPFLALVRKYSEDGNARGELDWFYKGMTDANFDAAVRSKPAGQIFIVDIPKRYWYYVVLKEEANKELPCTYSISIRINP